MVSSLSLSAFKKAFEGRLLYGWGLLCEKVSIVPVRANNKNYKFLRLDGNHGKKGPPPLDAAEADVSMFYLITKNRFLRRITQTKRQKAYDKKSFMRKNLSLRFGPAKHTVLEVNQSSTDPDPSTCMSVDVNHTTKEALFINISVHSFCNLGNMDEIMALMDALLKKIRWKHKVVLHDNAMKNGVRVAVYYMRKHKDDPDKFSKYQDYGFQVRKENLAKLRKIKKDVLKMSDEEATKKYDEELGILLSAMYRE
jgi:hypothetical protein